jgi:hypothetical protein
MADEVYSHFLAERICCVQVKGKNENAVFGNGMRSGCCTATSH